MKVFRGNDEFLTPEFVIKSLQEIATSDAKEGEYHKEEHICWDAAILIEKLNETIENKAPELWLRELADRLEHIEWMDKKDWIRVEDT